MQMRMQSQLIEWPSLGAPTPAPATLIPPWLRHALFGLSRWQVFALLLPTPRRSWRSGHVNLTFDSILIKKKSNGVAVKFMTPH